MHDQNDIKETDIHSYSPYEIGLLQGQLTEIGLADITTCFSITLRKSIAKEALRIFEKKAKRKDFFSAHTNKTPRNMFTVSESDITTESSLISNFYYSKNVQNLIQEIAGESISSLPWAGERFVINGLMNTNDTHGWHWDDYTYALVFIAESPLEESGGLLECISNTFWDKENPNIHHIIETNDIKSYYFPPLNFYFMKSDTTLHRVAPIYVSQRRLSIAMSYCNQADLCKQIDHKTVIDLYE